MGKRKRKQQPVLVLHRKSANRPEVKAAVKAVRSRGIDLKVRIPWNKKDKPRVVRELIAAGHQRLIAGGGDGTLNAIADALVRHAEHDECPTMGILPLGTANDLAHGLGLPCEDLDSCLYLAATGDAKPMDLGIMNGRHFINVASGGFGAQVTATTPQDVKRHLGGAAYTLNGLIKIWEMKPYRGSLHLPGQAPIEGSMVLMAVGNNRLAGGGFEVAPAADPADGLLDLMILTDSVITEPGPTLAELKDPLNPANTRLRYVQAPAFRIEAETPVHINLDGEPVVSKELNFSVLEHALNVVY
ncbi:lipid kinase YegS [Halioglobus maricola]|uniref:Lipid kinase YegS n=1 Tax=Halioglobus maricola TaxID=2601894 RepID=A0A5P9NLC5_9GAMM|nr:lipid kinase YegS [Halioglobus maricola]QFU76315.1 lipid kinase YegS [Halioglobus maricola]